MKKAVKNPRLGYFCAILAQMIWGCFPIYLHYIKQVPAADIVAHRVIWSFAILFGLMLLSKVFDWPMLPKLSEAKDTLGSSNKLLACFVAAVLIAINWCVFVWAANNDHKVDASLGYYICPQVMVLLGVFFLGERLSKSHWVAVAIVGGGVLMMTASSDGKVWISLLIAFSFGLYALCKKKTPMTALGGLTMETGCLLLPTIAFLVYQIQGGSGFLNGPLHENVLLLGCGIATISPLALYAVAVKHIPLSTVGFLQFIGPTIQFALGVFIFDEPFDWWRFIGFVVVWSGVVLFLFSKRPQPAGKAADH